VHKKLLEDAEFELVHEVGHEHLEWIEVELGEPVCEGVL
jgi:hypothetical protein